MWNNWSNYRTPRVRETEQWVIDANSKVIGCAFVEEQLNRDRNDQKRIRAVREARGTWATDKFYVAQKCHAASLWLRERFGLFGEANGARPSIIDGGFCEKKRTKVIQIAATLDNESRDRRVNFHAIYDCVRAYYRSKSHIEYSFSFQFYTTKLNFYILHQKKKSDAKTKFRALWNKKSSF